MWGDGLARQQVEKAFFIQGEEGVQLFRRDRDDFTRRRTVYPLAQAFADHGQVYHDCRSRRHERGERCTIDVIQFESDEASFVEFSPSLGGMWTLRPNMDFLEPVDDHDS